MRTNRSILFCILVALCTAAPVGVAAQSVLVEAKTAGGDEVATIRTDTMRLLVPLHLLGGGLLFPDGTVQTTAAVPPRVTSALIVNGTIVDADISASAAIADMKLGPIKTAGKVENSATTATASNTANAIVARDAAGGFEAGYVAAADSLRVRGEGSFLATGTEDAATTVLPPASGAGTRMMWYPEKAAFRAGVVSGTEWDGANVGRASTASGLNTTASGTASSAFGASTTASGTGSVAFGSGTTASSSDAVAFGYSSRAMSFYAVAMGHGTTASGPSSTAMGSNTTASGDYSTALGYTTTAEGTATLAIGSFNAEGTALFVAGNGTFSAPSNALTLYRNGNLTIAGALLESSDARLKEGIEPLEGTLDRVLQLTPIRYRFRAGTGHPEEAQIGLTAQEVEPLFPELVARGGDGYLSLSYANLSAVLVKAVQEQQAEIEALRIRNEGLESELATLRASQAEILRRLRALETAGNR